MPLLYGDKDMLFAKILGVWGRKFQRVKNQNFIRIKGPSGSHIIKPVTNSAEIEKIRNDNPSYRLYGSPEYRFDKRKALICEPEEDSDCPDYKGTDKHTHKRYAHTPATEYKVKCGRNFVCALSYLDLDKQKRKTYIALPEFEINT